MLKYFKFFELNGCGDLDSNQKDFNKICEEKTDNGIFGFNKKKGKMTYDSFVKKNTQYSSVISQGVAIPDSVISVYEMCRDGNAGIIENRDLVQICTTSFTLEGEKIKLDGSALGEEILRNVWVDMKKAANDKGELTGHLDIPPVGITSWDPMSPPDDSSITYAGYKAWVDKQEKPILGGLEDWLKKKDPKISKFFYQEEEEE